MFSRKLKIVLTVSTISVIIAFLGLSVLLLLRSVWLLAVFLGFWVLTNIAGGVICAQCPFRSKKCVGVCQLYFMPLISKSLYRKDHYSERALALGAKLVGVFGTLYYLIGFVSAFLLYWNDLLLVVSILLVFFVVHLILSFLCLCPNCPNKHNCPMAKVSKAMGKQ
ncbi:MAG: hypothetical protein ACFFCO_13175 [Promethearchaeota archaeon]